MYYDILDEEVEIALRKYENIFPDGFPLAQFDGNKKELLKEIKKCIKIKKEYDTSFWDNNPDIDD